MIERARALACRAHQGQRYGARPYRAHLDEVAALVRAYGETAIVLAYLHDIIEDTGTPPGELDRMFGAFITRCVLLLTDAPGASRGQRKARTCEKLRAIPAGAPEELALVVKAADRLANVRACLRDDPARLAMYRREHPAFRAAAYRRGLAEAFWQELDDHCGRA